MRRSPRRPLILRRRKLPFQQNDAAPAKSPCHLPAASDSQDAPTPKGGQSFPDGIRIMNHPHMSDTQVVVIPKAADLQSVIGALTTKGKESGNRGPNKFILLTEGSGGNAGSFVPTVPVEEDVPLRSSDGQAVKVEAVAEPVKTEVESFPSENSLSDSPWLDNISSPVFKTDLTKDKENEDPNSEALDLDPDSTPKPQSERPPYSYMAMIQFAINSREDRRMTLKDIYTWIEDHFPYFREVAKPGWKNSIRHNLSLHDMFTRETTADGKLSLWTIRPEVNRYLTLDQVYTPGSDPVAAPVPVLLFPPHQQRKLLPDIRRIPVGSERKIKPLLPRTDSYLVPIQLPVTPSVYLPPSSVAFPSSASLQKKSISRTAKKVRIAPKVIKSEAEVAPIPKYDEFKAIKVEPESVPVTRESPKPLPKRPPNGSRRKQRLVHSRHEEPVLLCPDNTLFDSGVASDASTFHDAEQCDDHQQQGERQQSPEREFSFKTPIKSSSSSQLISSTPSKPPSNILPEPWKVTPVGKGDQNLLDFSPIRTPGGPAVTPRHEYNTFSFNGTPFKDWPLFSSPRDHLASAPSRTADSLGLATPANRSFAEGLVLDTMNDSLSKILVDISFSGLEDEELGVANISWSEFIPQFM